MPVGVGSGTEPMQGGLDWGCWMGGGSPELLGGGGELSGGKKVDGGTDKWSSGVRLGL
jgi:hypothetical protein